MSVCLSFSISTTVPSLTANMPLIREDVVVGSVLHRNKRNEKVRGVDIYASSACLTWRKSKYFTPP